MGLACCGSSEKQAKWKERCLPRKQFKEATLQGHALAIARQPTRGLAAWRCVSCGLSSSSLRRLACTPSAPLTFLAQPYGHSQAVASADGRPGSRAHSAENRLHPALQCPRHGSPPSEEAQGICSAGVVAPTFSTHARRSLGRGPGRPKHPKHRLRLPIASLFAQQTKRLCLRLPMVDGGIGAGPGGPCLFPMPPGRAAPRPRFLRPGSGALPPLGFP